MTYPEANARLVPLQATANASGTKLTATEATGQAVALVTADTAYARMNMNLSAATASNLSGPIIASLYSYYNSAYGLIQPNGTVRLEYRGTPVWVLTAPRSGSMMTNWQHCPGDSLSS